MKFKSDIEVQAGLRDGSNDIGTAGQLLSSTGTITNWIDQDTIHSGSSEVVDIQVKNISSANGGVNLSKGDPVYIYGSVGASARLYVDLADADSTATNNLGDGKMPCVGLLDQDLTPNQEGTATVVGKLRNLITSPIDGATPNENDTVYVKSGGGLTLTKPTGSTNLIQNVGQVGRVSTSADGNIVVAALLRSNDVPNLTTGKIWVGDGNTVESTVVHLDETNGRMGINTNSPDTNLEIEQSGTPGIKFNNTAGGFPTFGSITAYNNTTYRGGLTWASTPVQNGAKITYVGFPSGSQKTGTFEVGSNFVDTSINDGSMVTRLTTTGLGIGTTSPAYMLDVDGEVRVGDNQKLKLWDDPFGAIITSLDAHLALTTTRTQDNIYFDPGNSTKMVIEGGGNVGIGTTNPDSKLEVASTASNTYLHVRNDSTGSTRLKMSNLSDTNSNGFQIINNGSNGQVNLLNYKASTLALWTNASQRLTILSSGNVGIGTTSPNEKLEVAGNTRITGNGLDVGYNNNGTNFIQIGNGRSTNGYAYIDLVGDSTYSDYGLRIIRQNSGANASSEIIHRGTGVFNFNASQAANMTFKTSGSERLRIESGGNVGIGTTDPSEKLHVKATSSSSSSMLYLENIAWAVNMTTGIAFKNGANYAGPTAKIYTIMNGAGNQGGEIRFATLDYSATNPNPNTTLIDRMTIDDTGDVGVGTTSPSEKLEVNGNVKANNYINQRVAWNSGFNHSSNTATSYYFIPVGYIAETPTDTYYNNWIAPYAGRVRKIVLRNTGQSTVPTATTVNFRVSVNGSVVYEGSTINVTGSGLNIYASETLSDTDAVFSATDRVQVAYRTNGLWRNVAAGISLEYTE